jgi:hypothetical protein
MAKETKKPAPPPAGKKTTRAIVNGNNKPKPSSKDK